MHMRQHKILVVEPDSEIIEILVAALSRRFDAQITCVADAESALDVDMVTPHDLVITELVLDDLEGLHLIERLMTLSVRPVILLAHEPTCEEAIAALRLGVRDLLCKPFPVTELLDGVARLLRGFEVHRAHLGKYRRMRDLVRRVIRERRDLKCRIDLICRDLVGAQRRLVHRVLESETIKVPGPG